MDFEIFGSLLQRDYGIGSTQNAEELFKAVCVPFGPWIASGFVSRPNNWPGSPGSPISPLSPYKTAHVIIKGHGNSQ